MMLPAEVHVPLSSLTWTVTAFAFWRSFMANDVSPMPSGPVIPSLTTTSSVVPATASTTRLSQSVLIP